MKQDRWKIPTHTGNQETVAGLFSKISERLQLITQKYTQIKFATSLAAEDMVLTDAIVRGHFPIQIFTLNTGRLHQASLDMLDNVQQHYGVKIQVVEPNFDEVDRYVQEHGMNAFYDSEDAKKMCCDIRKVKPLNSALVGANAWLTGQRRAQSVTRSELHFEELDQARHIAKFNPIFDFSDDDVWSFLQLRNVPMHPLHQQGYPSIGCEPCTRAIRADEEIRAGRWWWLQQTSKECGLHVTKETEV